MASRNYGIFHQGAIFYEEDFDPIKVIIAVSEKIMELTLSENIKTALLKNEFSIDIATAICELLNIDVEDISKLQDYSHISNDLVIDAEYMDWFDSSKPLMGNTSVEVRVFTDIESEYIYANNQIPDESLSECYMFSLYCPPIWDIGDYQGCKTKDEVLNIIREAASTLLKDDIEWENRLGYLIGSVYE